MRTFYFEYFEHAWLHTPKIIVLTSGKLQCLSACQKHTSSSTSFLRYYMLKNLAIWLVKSNLAHNSRTRIEPVMGNKKNQFLFRLNFWKNPEKPILGPLAKLNFPGKKKALPVFMYSNYLPSWKKSEKTNDPFLSKTRNWQTDRQADKQADRQQWF